MKQRKRPGGGSESAKAASTAGKPDVAFDLWLKRGLHQIFDDIAAEPIPESLLKIIDEDRKITKEPKK